MPLTLVMLGSFITRFFSIVHLLLLNVDSKVLIDHETGSSKRNCSALLNISLFEDDMSGDKSECPPWFNRDNETGLCRAGPTLNGLIQQDMSTLQTSVMQCYCMTEENGVLAVSVCLYQCLSKTPYYLLPCQASQLQNHFCLPHLKRNGTLCSKCINGYAYPVYSYKMECVMCRDYHYNWLKYLAAAYLPLTLFYIVVAMFSISFTSPMIIGVVMVCQLMASPAILQILEGFASDTKYGQFLKLGATIASFFNLDFGRIYYSFCLNPNASAVLLSCLDYGIVVFPVLLIFVTNLLVKLHTKGVRPIVWCWLAAMVILKPLRRQLRVKTSLIDVFASFLYLSLSRLLITSIYLLIPVEVYYMRSDGNLVTQHCVFNEPAFIFFGKQHRKYALLAIFMFVLFFLLPVILLLSYPFSCFQRFLNRTGLNYVALRTFIDVFQGYYKDGTNGTKDYRCFCVFPFLFPLIVCSVFTVTKCVFFYHFASFFGILYVTLILVLQPFKQFMHNVITAIMLTALVMGSWSMIINNTDSTSPLYINFSIILLTVSLCIPFVYALGLACFVTKKLMCP